MVCFQGIYPTAVIVLVDVVKSHSERTRHEDSINTPQIASPGRQPSRQLISLAEILSPAEQYYTAIDTTFDSRMENSEEFAFHGVSVSDHDTFLSLSTV